MGLLDLTAVTGSSREDVQKLRIRWIGGPTRSPQGVTVAYNPGQIYRRRSVAWNRTKMRVPGSPLSNARQRFVGVDAETLSLDLLFDTYESGQDVRAITERIAALARVDQDLHEPPICRLSWGTQAELFTGVMTSLDQRFTLFRSDGTPVRATLACSFLEYETTAAAKASEPHSSDVVKTRIARRGETLASIAAQEYQDPARWREIAVANGITNPRELTPGTVLTIPKLAG